MNQQLTLNKRNPSIDYVKVWASFSVISIHFRLNVQEMIPIETFGKWTSLFFSVIYQIFIPCVPLFLIATGYLMNRKTYSLKYYITIFKVFSLYVLCSLITYGIMMYYAGTVLTLKEVIYSIERFQLIPYSWYVEMYIGFAIIIPLINIFIQRTSQKELGYLIISLMLICSIPPFINSNPQLNRYFYLSSSWISLYPILYYLIGALLHKYYDVETIRHRKHLLFLLAAHISSTLIGIYINFANADPSAGASEGGYPSIIVVIQSVSLFLLIISLFRKENRLVASVSKLTLSIYLMSFAVDQIIYPYFLSKLGQPEALLVYMTLISSIIFTLSILLASLVQQINTLSWFYIEKILKALS